MITQSYETAHQKSRDFSPASLALFTLSERIFSMNFLNTARGASMQATLLPAAVLDRSPMTMLSVGTLLFTSN